LPQNKNIVSDLDCTDNSNAIVIEFSNLTQGKPTNKLSKQQRTEPFMGLEELFWQCYAVSPKTNSQGTLK
jgi:hypothetical protein